MYTALIVLLVIAVVVLVLVILAQNSKGGVGSNFGGSGSSQMMGVKKTSDILEKITWGSAVVLIVFSIGATVVKKGETFTDEEEIEDANVSAAENSGVTTPAATPIQISDEDIEEADIEE